MIFQSTRLIPLGDINLVLFGTGTMKEALEFDYIVVSVTPSQVIEANQVKLHSLEDKTPKLLEFRQIAFTMLSFVQN